jgi:hypothetical protein
VGVPRLPEPRVTLIEGVPTLVIERRPPLPQHLPDLLARLRVYPVRITGWRSDCGQQEHRLTIFAEGIYLCLDNERRELRLYVCRDCETVCVRDITIDRLPGLAPGRLTPRRRDKVLAWYTGARRNQRTYT